MRLDRVARMSAPVVAEIVRSGFVEGHHYGSVVVLAPDGSVDWSVGDVTSAILPRSCNKPIQALGMLRAGLRLEADLLALASASHSGEPFHLDGVRRILAQAGLDETALQTPPDYPLDEEAREQLLRSGGEPVVDRDELLGQARRDAGDLRGERLGHRDLPRPRATRCRWRSRPPSRRRPGSRSRPSPSTAAVRRCSRRPSSASPGRSPRIASATGGPEQQVADAIRAFPEMTSGTRRDEAALLRAVPGSVGKAGAESCYALGLADGRAVALKTDDGAARVRPVLMAAALERMGVLDEPGVDADAVRRTGVVELLGGGRPVGEIRATLRRDD